MPERGIPLEIGKGRILREGTKVALLSLGTRLAEALKAAVEVLKTAPEARAHVKRMLNEQYAKIDYETMFASLAHGTEVREGMRSFMEKRQPNWIPDDLPEV